MVVESLVVESGVSTSVNLQLEVADVFLFDDDEGDEYETYFLSSIEELGLSVNYRDLTVWGSPVATRFGPVEEPVIIWFTGDVDSGAISQVEEDSLMAFLDVGGRLFLTGQNIVENLSPTSPLLTDYLQVSYGGEPSRPFAREVEFNPVTSGVGRFALTGLGGANNQTSLDILVPTGESLPALYYNLFGEIVAAVSREDTLTGSKLFLTGFGFEGVINDNVGFSKPYDLMARVLNWFDLDVVITGTEDELTSLLPQELSLSQNYPNPFNPVTTTEYSLPYAGYVSLVVYNLLGEVVASLVDGELPAGTHKTVWDASDFASGIYFYRLQTGDFVQTRKMVLLK